MNDTNFALHYDNYTDIKPCEVVRVVSEKCVEVRYMDCQLDPSWEPGFPNGGYLAHLERNYKQRWIITSNPKNPVFKIRLRKDGWRCKSGDRFEFCEKPIRFHDFRY